MRIAKIKRTTLLSTFASDATELNIKEFVDHNGNDVTIADLDNLLVVTLRQGDEIEMVLCNAITKNSNSVTLAVAPNGRNLSGTLPYLGSSTGKDFTSNTSVVVGNDPYTLYVTGILYMNALAIAGAPDAAPTVKGIVQEATQAQHDARTLVGGTGAKLFAPMNVLRGIKISDYIADTGAANAYVITPNPAITAYSEGQIFTFKVANVNTGGSTLAVSGLPPSSLRNYDGTEITANGLGAGQIITVVRVGANFQVLNKSEIVSPLQPPIVRVYTVNDTWAKPVGLKYITIEGTGGGAGGEYTTGNGVGTGGGAAAWFRKTISAADLAATEALTVGVGGVGESSAGAGQTPGGATLFGAHATANGGNIDGTGGTWADGDIGADGELGGRSANDANWSLSADGKGGDNPYGRSSQPLANSDGVPGTGYGVGGSAGASTNSTNRAGGNGRPGVIIVTEHY